MNEAESKKKEEEKKKVGATQQDLSKAAYENNSQLQVGTNRNWELRL